MQGDMVRTAKIYGTWPHTNFNNPLVVWRRARGDSSAARNCQGDKQEARGITGGLEPHKFDVMSSMVRWGMLVAGFQPQPPAESWSCPGFVASSCSQHAPEASLLAAFHYSLGIVGACEASVSPVPQ
ncbi:predicted protein [Pyrenophora tritici-repentis Pt-1C-BFP]|uniref:Uncharacterized protein n=1 Tax=Pyrenophora tritici-repentis (strain Pt-1C-BFP) TaxID=426418 RepID=B2VXG2_PYRTR|nr:uncharacterized protein PTRG_03208 [Pyrenophora tritici-repentis Pt-1C-BFP]EDU45731.1 predicted protein [Pyrenophora tritici-repentis Pt-1C-BFP]